ncbi:hypothetical protein AAMO2058_001414200 [Amorphochlora amoebiformis]
MAAWIPDAFAENCTDCQEKFTLLNRKHHCRRCGHVFCYSCSVHRKWLPRYKKPVRVCNGCYVKTNRTRTFFGTTRSSLMHQLGVTLVEGESVWLSDNDVAMYPGNSHKLLKKTQAHERTQSTSVPISTGNNEYRGSSGSERPSRDRTRGVTVDYESENLKAPAKRMSMLPYPASSIQKSPIVPSLDHSPTEAKSINFSHLHIQGVLALTDLRLIFAFKAPCEGVDGKGEKLTTRTLCIPIRSIARLDRLEVPGTDMGGIIVVCNDVRRVSFFWEGLVGQKRYQKYSDFFEALNGAFRPQSNSRSFPFSFINTVLATRPVRSTSPSITDTEKSEGKDLEERESWWHRVDVALCDEFHRMVGPPKKDSKWRLSSVNQFYEVCSSYPPILPVPACLNDEEIQEASLFRSKNRLPVLSWTAIGCGSALMRSAQPMTGVMARKRNQYDEKIIESLAESSGSGSVFIADARPQVNAVANMAKGGGYENIRHYSSNLRVELDFLGIQNIHVMRRAYKVLLGACFDAMEKGGTYSVTFQESLAKSGWLLHISQLLVSINQITARLMECTSVLVHCSDSWDRTPQLVSLAQLCVDPYYRTRCGFRTLFEREWMLYGHRFSERHGTGFGKELEDKSQQSPILLQFVDAVWQIVAQFPTAFEFNTMFLLHFLDGLKSGQHLEFYYNTEKERRNAISRASPAGDLPPFHVTCDQLWEGLCGDSKYRNPLYNHNIKDSKFSWKNVLVPQPYRVRLWHDFFFRWAPLHFGVRSKIRRGHRVCVQPSECEESKVLNLYSDLKRKAKTMAKEAHRLRDELKRMQKAHGSVPGVHSSPLQAPTVGIQELLPNKREEEPAPEEDLQSSSSEDEKVNLPSNPYVLALHPSETHTCTEPSQSSSLSESKTPEPILGKESRNDQKLSEFRPSPKNPIEAPSEKPEGARKGEASDEAAKIPLDFYVENMSSQPTVFAGSLESIGTRETGKLDDESSIGADIETLLRAPQIKHPPQGDSSSNLSEKQIPLAKGLSIAEVSHKLTDTGKSVGFSESNRSLNSKASALSGSRKSNNQQNVERLQELSQKYSELASTKAHWQKDEDAKCCPICQKTFSMLFRKHHCR